MSNIYENLAKRVPVVSEQAKKQLDAGRQVALQSSLGASQIGSNRSVVGAAQQVGAQQVAQAGQQDLAVRQQATQQIQGLQDQQLQQDAQDAQLTLGQRELGTQQQLAGEQNQLNLDLNRDQIQVQKELTDAEIATTRRLTEFGIEQDNQLLNVELSTREYLSNLGSDVKDKILDSRLRFEKDELGRRFSNERQLADWTVANAKTDIEVQSRMRDLVEASERKVLLLETAYNKIIDAEKQGFLSEEQALDFEHTKGLAELKRAMERKIRKEQARAANNMAMAQGAGIVIGAAAGVALAPFTAGTSLAVGPAAGAAIGATLGAGLGQAVHAGTSG